MDRTTHPTATVERTSEVTALAWQLYDDNLVDGYDDALRQADRQLEELLHFAADWDAHVFDGDPAPPPAPTAEGLYVPGALDPHEQRGMDKALYMRAGGLVPRIVGRFAFVPSRTTGGTVYRLPLDGSTCTCAAGEAGRRCWHQFSVLLHRELAA